VSAALLRVERLQRRAGAFALYVEELEVRDGEVVAVLGPNGAGKSTLFRTLLLLEPADAGRILIHGVEARCGDVSARRRMAGVFQRPHLFAGSVADNVAFAPRALDRDRASVDAAVKRALESVQLTEASQRDVNTLSGGEVQRVALARALAAEPELLLLDEPTASLDAQGKRRFRGDLERAVRRSAGAALIITHDPADALALADRVLVLERGRVVQTGTPTDLMAAPATSFIAAFTGAELLLDGLVGDSEGDLVTVDLAGGLAVRAVAPAPIPAGGRALVAYRPEDVVLSGPEAGHAGSARNHLMLRVAAMTPDAGLVRCRLEGPVDLVALITRDSARELGLAPGTPVTAHLKVSALRAYPAT
jgi:molybdate transport system ATP-binding protein